MAGRLAKPEEPTGLWTGALEIVSHSAGDKNQITGTHVLDVFTAKDFEFTFQNVESFIAVNVPMRWSAHARSAGGEISRRNAAGLSTAGENLDFDPEHRDGGGGVAALKMDWGERCFHGKYSQMA